MAQAIKSVNVTPADELRDLLTLNEKRVVDLRGQGAKALDLLLDLDRIVEMWPQLEAQGVDLRPELGRWETLQAAVQSRGAVLVQEMRAAGGLSAVRRQQHPGGAAGKWWFLAEQVRAQRMRRWRRAGIIFASSVTVVGLLYVLVFHVLFPVDPNVRAAYNAQSAGERKLATEGDLVGALADFRRVTELMPDDPTSWLRVGCTLLRLGDAAGAAENFRQAEVLVADGVAFRLFRAPICQSLGVLDVAEADLRAVIADDPENATAYYYLSVILEQRGVLAEALAAVERAAELADASGDTQLVALARFRMGMLMQQQMVVPGSLGVTPTP